jgi:hypothetical protein
MAPARKGGIILQQGKIWAPLHQTLTAGLALSQTHLPKAGAIRWLNATPKLSSKFWYCNFNLLRIKSSVRLLACSSLTVSLAAATSLSTINSPFDAALLENPISSPKHYHLVETYKN